MDQFAAELLNTSKHFWRMEEKTSQPVVSLPWVSAANVSSEPRPLPCRSRRGFARGQDGGFDPQPHLRAAFRRGCG